MARAPRHAAGVAEDETDRNRLREAIVEAFPALDAEIMRAALKQNRMVWLQKILDYFKLDTDAAVAWVAWKAPDLWKRYGAALEAEKLGKMILDCAEGDASLWRAGKLKRRAAVSEPVQLGAAVMAALDVADVAADDVAMPVMQPVARRAPQAAEEPPRAAPSAPMSVAAPNGASMAQLACETIATLARSYGEINPSQADYRDGKEGVAAAAALWALVQAGGAWRIEGERRVVMLAGPEVLTDWLRREIREWLDMPLTTRGVEVVWADAPRVAAPTLAPSMAPLIEEERSAIVRRPSARPSWWGETMMLLRTTAGRWRHQDGDIEGADRIAQLAEQLKVAVRVELDEDGTLRVELGSRARVEQLRAGRVVWAPELLRVAQMTAPGAVQRVVILEIEEPGEPGEQLGQGVAP